MTKGTISLFLCVLLTLTVFLGGGCRMFSADKERKIRQYSRISDMNRRMMVQDAEAIFLLDRPSSLSRWLVHNN